VPKRGVWAESRNGPCGISSGEGATSAGFAPSTLVSSYRLSFHQFSVLIYLSFGG
jgi:hypothetical protein